MSHSYLLCLIFSPNFLLVRQCIYYERSHVRPGHFDIISNVNFWKQKSPTFGWYTTIVYLHCTVRSKSRDPPLTIKWLVALKHYVIQ